MATELAVAYISLVPSAKGMQKSIAQEFAGVEQDAEKAGKKSGGRFSGAVVTGAKVATGAIAAAGTAWLGTALFKGGQRLLGIEDAQAKLAGLGHDGASIARIMDDALASVRGTAFGLDTAVSVAAGVVASGVKPGEDLERVLRLVGDAATIAGTGMDEMGSIFNKVSAGNRLTMAEVNQLQDRGLPIMQMIADQYGVTGEEARKMVEQGKVDFASFSTAIETNLAGAALKSGNTTRGALANVGAAMGRFGASILSEVFPSVRGGLQGVITWIDNATESVGPFAEQAGVVLRQALEWLGDWWRRNGPEITMAVQRMGRLVAAALSGVARAVRWVIDNWDTLKWAVATAAAIMLPHFVALGVQATVSATKQVAAWVMSSAGAIGAAVTHSAQVALMVGRWVFLGVQSLLHAAKVAAAWLIAMGPIALVIAAVVGLVALIVLKWDEIKQIIAAGWEWVRRTTVDLWNRITGAVSSGVSAAVEWVSGLPGRAVAAIQAGAQALMDAGRWIVDRVLEGIKFVADVAGGLFSWFTDLPGWLFDKAMAGAQKLVELGAEFIGKIVEGIKKAPGAIVDAISGLIPDNPLPSWIPVIGGSGDGPGRPAGGGGATLARVQRAIAGTGARVSSTYRTPEHNRRVGGSPRSYHMDRANPAVDIVASSAAILDRVHARLVSMGGWREMLWRVPNHAPGDNMHIHVAHQGGWVEPSWPTMPGLRADERPAILQVGERVVPRGDGGGGTTFVINAPEPTAEALHRTLDRAVWIHGAALG